jgi:hypothetical protein
VSVVACNWANLRVFSLLQVVGKALMLDEIINYVQSLQQQVEVRTPLLFAYITQVIARDSNQIFCLLHFY